MSNGLAPDQARYFVGPLDPDQVQHFVGPDLDPNCLQRLSVGGTCRQK